MKKGVWEKYVKIKTEGLFIQLRERDNALYSD